jgi:hypothetical protein
MADTYPLAFEYDAFIAAFPGFTGTPGPVAAAQWDMANLYFANDATNPAVTRGAVVMRQLLNLVTAHLLTLLGYPVTGGGSGKPAGMVGRISSASEGSVSVSAEWKGSGSPSEEWWLMTQYGAMFWQATAQFRTMRYVPNPTVVYGGINPLVGTYRGR